MDKNGDPTPSSTLQVVNALIKVGKQFDLLVMAGQGHGVLGSAYGWEKMVRFFMQHLVNLDPR
jgi:hypothetical protein